MNNYLLYLPIKADKLLIKYPTWTVVPLYTSHHLFSLFIAPPPLVIPKSLLRPSQIKVEKGSAQPYFTISTGQWATDRSCLRPPITVADPTEPALYQLRVNPTCVRVFVVSMVDTDGKNFADVSLQIVLAKDLDYSTYLSSTHKLCLTWDQVMLC